jgi:hypothetical protein
MIITKGEKGHLFCTDTWICCRIFFQMRVGLLGGEHSILNLKKNELKKVKKFYFSSVRVKWLVTDTKENIKKFLAPTQMVVFTVLTILIRTGPLQYDC